MHKTGSTSLQNFCRAHEEILNKHDIYYPKQGCQDGANHSNLAWDIANSPQFNQDFGGIAEVCQELREADSEIGIISGEEFEFLDDEAVIHAAKSFEEFDTTVVVCLRRQDTLIRSEYIEWLKFGATSYDFHTAQKIMPNMVRFNFLRVLDRWAIGFSKAKILVRIFDPEQLVGGDIVIDFFHAIGKEAVLEETPAPVRENVTPKKKTVSALLLANRLVKTLPPQDVKGGLHFALGRTRKLAENTFEDNTESFQGYRNSEAIHLLNRFAVSNHDMQQRYLPHLEEPCFKPAKEFPKFEEGLTLSKEEVQAILDTITTG